MASLCLEPARSPGVLRVAVIGPVDRQTADSFARSISTFVHAPGAATTQLVLDLRCCTAMDAEGAAALARIRTTVEEQGGGLELEGVPPLIEHVLRGTRGQPT